MSRKKLSPSDARMDSTSDSGSDLGSTKEEFMDGDPVELPAEVNFETLPDEMLVKIYSYLGHGDKLAARLVNQRWCRVLSSWSGFNNSVVYLLKEGADSKVTLKRSLTPWKKLRIDKFRLDSKGHEKVSLPNHIVNNFTSLELCKCIITWNAVKQIVVMFKSLEELNIIQCKRRRKECQSSPPVMLTRGFQVLQGAWETCLKKLKSVTLELRRISDLKFYLHQFQPGMQNLLVLTIREIFDGIETVTSEDAEDFFQVFYAVLYDSRKTIKTLVVQLVTRLIVNSFFPEVILKITNQGLNLVTFDVRHIAVEPGNTRDLQILGAFFRTQKNLMHTRLPHPGNASDEDCKRLVSELPSTIKCIHVGHEQYLIPNFLEVLHDMCHLDIDCEVNGYSPNKTKAKFPKLCALEMKRGLLSTTSIPEMILSFPNLVELDLNSSGDESVMLDDQCLQAISKNLKLLRSLILGSCLRITDYGATGIRKEYCEKLYRSRSMCIGEHTQTIPSFEITGVPLSSLKGLINLTFTGPTSITDVGIFYGFRFTELRFLNIRNNIEISDWGIDLLGRLNPNLEELYFGAGPWVTPVGLAHLRSRLRRIKRRHFIVVPVNQEYYSSDESYAMESGSDDVDAEHDEFDRLMNHPMDVP